MKTHLFFLPFALFLLGAEAPKDSRIPIDESRQQVQKKEDSPRQEPQTNISTLQIIEPEAEPQQKTKESTGERIEEQILTNRASLKANEKIAEETERLAKSTDLLASFTKYLVLVAIFQALLFAWQLRLIRQSTKSTETAALAAQRNAEAMVLAQRAYLNTSPYPPDQNLQVAVAIKNYGETPATITTIAIHHDISLPTDRNNPGPPDTAFAGHYLVRNEYFFHWIDGSPYPSGTTYFLYGYIDYITEFKEHRRFGFAREYRGGQFVFVSERGWSYDKERQPGEGNDWKD